MPRLRRRALLHLTVVLRYQSGEEIQEGDNVLFHGEPARIEIVAVNPGDPKTVDLVQEYGGGIMILERVTGRTFITADQIPDYEDLEFLSRSKDLPAK